MPQSGQHLVQQQHPGAQRQCLGQLEAAGVGDGQLARWPVGERTEADLVEHLVGRGERV